MSLVFRDSRSRQRAVKHDLLGPPSLIDRGPVRLGKEGIDPVVGWRERERVRPFLRRNGFQESQRYGIHDVNDARVADGDVEVLSRRIEKDDIGHAAQRTLPLHLSGPRIKHD